MKYLFFDCEFATTKYTNVICEFGYVVVDESFNVIERDNLIMNPNIEHEDWDWYALENILTRAREEYETKPLFKEHYQKIVELINTADHIFGHTLFSDAKGLDDECKRYGLSSIDFDFYDIKDMYMKYTGGNTTKSLITIMKELNVAGDETTHDAGADAYNTMLSLKALLDMLKIDVESIVISCEELKTRNEKYHVTSLKPKKNKNKKPLVYITDTSIPDKTNIGNRFADIFAELEKDLED